MRDILHELRATGPTALDVTDAEGRHVCCCPLPTYPRTGWVMIARRAACRRLRVCGHPRSPVSVESARRFNPLPPVCPQTAVDRVHSAKAVLGDP